MDAREKMGGAGGEERRAKGEPGPQAEVGDVMRTVRLSLVGTVILALLGGFAAATATADDDAASAVHAVGAFTLDEMITPGTVTYTSGGVRQLRGLVATQQEDWSDSRLSGVSTLVFNEDEYPELMGPKWGTTRLENDGGAWEGSYLAIQLPRDEGPDIPTYLTTMVGEGGYAGLSALCFAVYAQGPGWEGAEPECIIFPGPVPVIGGLPEE